MTGAEAEVRLNADRDVALTGATLDRQRRHALLVRASTAALEAAWRGFASSVSLQMLRPPEVALVMLRGQIGGAGDAFHLGEASLCRCVIALRRVDTPASASAEPLVGVGYVLGRDRRKAELVACFDALARMPHLQTAVQAEVLDPLARMQQAERARRAEKTAASQVNFLTMVRGPS